MRPTDDTRGDPPTETIELGGLSLWSRGIIALSVAVLATYAIWHLAMVFFFVAPSNTVSEEYRSTVRGYMYPEFEQNWKLFAPNPLQRNVAVHARVEIDGQVTDWVDLTAMDIDAIDHHPAPSHADQNLLRRAWDFYTGAHDEEGEPVGMRGELSESYIRRIALLRLDESGVDVRDASRLQLRESLTRVPAPSWRTEDFDTATAYEELAWWNVTRDDLPGGGE
ncbi:DUF5819 family protein [Streptomyces hainanensis]|uniref:Uncharacterized protein n=1 Tax=Streptomyces hainanensis TaxID=402648 RepID=A0A4V6PBY2_9ACTN|nr:DUF5819 family protein [Streptomyces hainanensis]TDC80205.1 hypothetical protein E1283_01075 [Streptomyces hainanensis]